MRHMSLLFLVSLIIMFANIDDIRGTNSTDTSSVFAIMIEGNEFYVKVGSVMADDMRNRIGSRVMFMGDVVFQHKIRAGPADGSKAP